MIEPCILTIRTLSSLELSLARRFEPDVQGVGRTEIWGLHVTPTVSLQVSQTSLSALLTLYPGDGPWVGPRTGDRPGWHRRPGKLSLDLFPNLHSSIPRPNPEGPFRSLSSTTVVGRLGRWERPRPLLPEESQVFRRRLQRVSFWTLSFHPSNVARDRIGVSYGSRPEGLRSP